MEIGQLAAKPASQVWRRQAGHAAMQWEDDRIWQHAAGPMRT